ncbi:MAG: paraquat-inducible protein A [Cypionkella sp.]
MFPRSGSYLQVVALSVSVVILMVSALFFPFLTISVAAVTRTTSVFEVAFAFSDGILQPLSFVVLGMIMLVPTLRAAALVYVIWPLAHGRRAYRNAPAALRLSEVLQPWSMAEIFVFGTSVALVKIAGLATVSLGPAFWAFCGLVLLITLNDNSLCKWTLWQDLEDSTNS